MYDEELKKWFQELKSDSYLFYAMAVVQVSQILRISEVAAMKWSNLCLEHREYSLAEHVIWPRHNGESPEIVPGTKTNRSGEILKSFLRQESVEVLSLLKSQGIKSDLVFTFDGSILTYRQIQYAYDKAFKKAGLPFQRNTCLPSLGRYKFLGKDRRRFSATADGIMENPTDGNALRSNQFESR